MTASHGAPLTLHLRRKGPEPAPELLALRESEKPIPVRMPWGPPGWLVTRHADVRAVLADAATFGNDASADAVHKGQAHFESALPLLNQDAPEHTRARRFLMPGFTVRRMRRLEPRIQTIVAEHLDALDAAGSPADLVAEFALPIPTLVICELLGVPEADRADIEVHSRHRADLALPVGRRTAAADAMQERLARFVADQRRAAGSGLVGELVRRHDAELDDKELVALADVLLFAGHTTTSNMLALGTVALLQRPEQVKLARAQERLSYPAIEELIRYLSIVPTTVPRIVRADTVVAGQPMRRGEVVLCSLPAANRDVTLGGDIDQLDLSRKSTSHVGFGHGVHHCVGAPLARAQLRIAFPALFRRFPELHITKPVAQLPFMGNSFVSGIAALPVAW
jgi:cytochrome P450